MGDSLEVNGAAIRRARKAKGLTQADLAEMAGCYRFTILRIERCYQRASCELIESIAEALGADLPEFYIGRASPGGHQPAHIGEVIRTARKARGLTQAELARKVFCCVGTITSLELGTRRTGCDLVEAVGEILKIDLSRWGHVRRPRHMAPPCQPSWRSSALQTAGTLKTKMVGAPPAPMHDDTVRDNRMIMMG
jgi:transcriptional regulator with XRE-family HTH domain